MLTQGRQCFSVQQLATGDSGEDKELHIPAIAAVSIAFLTKLCLFLYCFSIRGADSQVGVLWEDQCVVPSQLDPCPNL